MIETASEMLPKEKKYNLYIIICADGTLYTGITVNLDRRLQEHNSSKRGAKYTRGKRPVRLVYSKEFCNRIEAAREERRIKSLSRSAKLDLVNGVGQDIRMV